VTRLPDGEPGERANWVLTQTPHFLDDPTLDVVDVGGKPMAGLQEAGALGRDVFARVFSSYVSAPPSDPDFGDDGCEAGSPTKCSAPMVERVVG
jgi:hypothetical protein